MWTRDLMKIIFFGSDDFAAAHLEYLLKKGFSVAACVTQPDKPRDRTKITFSPIKEIALREKIDCLQPETLKDTKILADLKKFQADVFVVIAYGKILPQSILDIPRMGAVNVHGSLLPKYRGAAPINRAVINGEKETGVTIIRMSADLDAGDILAAESLFVGDDETAESVRRRMMDAGLKVLARTLRAMKDSKIKATAQNPAGVTFAPKLTKEMGKIDWNKSAREIHNLIRGLTPWPKAYTLVDGKILKILRAKMGQSPVERGTAPGQIIAINPEGIVVACGRGAVVLLDVLPESSRPMDAPSFARGHGVKTGACLGIS